MAARGPCWKPCRVLCSLLGHSGHRDRGCPSNVLDKSCHSAQLLKGVAQERTRYLSLLLQPASHWLAVSSSHPSCLVGVIPHFLERSTLQFGFHTHVPVLCVSFCPLAGWTPMANFYFWQFDLLDPCHRDRLSSERSRAEQPAAGPAPGLRAACGCCSVKRGRWELASSLCLLSKLIFLGTETFPQSTSFLTSLTRVLSTHQGRFLPTLALSTAVREEGYLCSSSVLLLTSPSDVLYPWLPWLEDTSNGAQTLSVIELTPPLIMGLLSKCTFRHPPFSPAAL